MPELDFIQVVIDETSICSYLPEQTARMPLSLPRRPLTLEQTEQLLDNGYRRSGVVHYRTQCPNCCACEPLRVDVDRFRPSRSQRRVLARGNRQLDVRIQRPTCDLRRIDLFNRHRMARDLAVRDGPIDEAAYRSFLVESRCDSRELSFWFEDKLLAVSVVDVAFNSLSAVYCFFDPDYARFSLGTYSILQQMELTRRTDRQWLHLGMYVAVNRHLNYKAKYLPHQRLIGGQWYEFGKALQNSE